MATPELDELNDGLQGLAPVEPRKLAGIMSNAQRQKFPGFMTGASYQLAIVEFDDQGRCYDRQQMDKVAQRLESLALADQPEKGEDVILVVFVHGWKHDARSDDDNLIAFRALLNETVRHEQETAAPAKPRPVMGIFVGWRGLSEFGLGDAVANATFWGRQAAGQRVATGSPRELFGRLRHYRNRRRNQGGNPLLVIAGHSFGGMIVFSALAQSLIEAASAPAGRLVPQFADLVLLVNPAIEGARYLPIQDLVCGADFKSRTTKQLPVFICAQAENDQPIGTWFPVGNIRHKLDEATIGDLEKECVTHALGFVPTFRTHVLAGPQGSDPFVLNPPGSAQVNPFWVVGAAKEVIDGHGGIWQESFLRFIATLLFSHVRVSRKEPAAAAAPAAAPDLAALARSIGPIKLPPRK